MGKIDADGNYTPFLGLTVVAPVSAADRSGGGGAWAAVHAAIARDTRITQHVTPLPLDSFHLTTTGLLTERDLEQCAEMEFNRRWAERVDRELPWYRALHAAMAREPPAPLSGRLGKLYIGRAVLVEVVLDGAQAEEVHAQAARWGITDAYPDAVPDPFHVTLGYVFRPPATAAERARFEEALHAAVFGAVPPGTAVTFEPTRLTYFRAMTAFVPWDASFNPFRGIKGRVRG